MRPNRGFFKYLREKRSALVRQVLQDSDFEEEQLKQLELAHARWVTAVLFLHAHKPLVAKQLVRKYEEYKIQCREVEAVPLPPWLFDYEHVVFLIDVNVLSRELYSAGRTDGSSGFPEGVTTLPAGKNTGE